MGLDPLVEFLMVNPARRPTIYVCGPMRGIDNLNFPMFNKVTALLRKSGFDVISPAESDRLAKMPWTRLHEPDFGDKDWPISKQDLRAMLRRDIEAILSLRAEAGDFLVLLPGWRESTGGFAETANARWLTLPTREIEFRENGPWLTEANETDWGAKAKMVADPYFPGRN